MGLLSLRWTCSGAPGLPCPVTFGAEGCVALIADGDCAGQPRGNTRRTRATAGVADCRCHSGRDRAGDRAGASRPGTSNGLPCDRTLCSPTNRRRLPTNRRRLPANRRWLPANRRRLPSNRRRLPANRRRLPANRRRLPSAFFNIKEKENLVPEKMTCRVTSGWVLGQCVQAKTCHGTGGGARP